MIVGEPKFSVSTNFRPSPFVAIDDNWITAIESNLKLKMETSPFTFWWRWMVVKSVAIRASSNLSSSSHVDFIIYYVSQFNTTSPSNLILSWVVGSCYHSIDYWLSFHARNVEKQIFSHMKFSLILLHFECVFH